MFLKKLVSQNGSALIYAMVGSLGVAGLALVLMQRAQIEKRIAMKYKADADVNIAVVDIAAHLLIPQHCNATFRGLSTPPEEITGLPPVEVNAIRKCTSGSCATGTSYEVYRAVLNAANMAGISAADRWKTFYTKFPGGSTTSASGESSIRLVKASMYLTKSSTLSPAPGAPGEVKLDLVFEKKTAEAQVDDDPAHKTNRVVKTIYVPVMTGTNVNGAIQPTLTLQGCPKSPTSPALYNP